MTKKWGSGLLVGPRMPFHPRVSTEAGRPQCDVCGAAAVEKRHGGADAGNDQQGPDAPPVLRRPRAYTCRPEPLILLLTVPRRLPAIRPRHPQRRVRGDEGSPE